jgi:hypothetical protein
MGVPSTDVDEADVVAIAHQPCDAPRFELEAARAERVAARGFHLARKLLHHSVTNAESFGHRSRERGVLVHGGDDRALARIDSRPAQLPQGDVRHLHVAAEGHGQLVGERDRAAAFGEHARETIHEARLVVPAALMRLSQLDRVLRLEVAAREIVGSGERHERELTLSVERKQ